MSRKRVFINQEQEQQIYNEYFSEEKPSTYALAKKHGCSHGTIRNIVIRNGYILRDLSESHKGQKSWNKGRINVYSEETLQEIKIRTKIAMQDPKVREKIRTRTKEAMNRLGMHEKISIRVKDAIKDKIPWNKDKKMSEEIKQKIREKTILYYQTHHGPYKDTKPELKMKEILVELNIPFECQFRVGNHLVDFHLLGTNILIEVAGDYWHGNPKIYSKLNKTQEKNRQRDLEKEKIAKDNNYILLRFWESTILNNVEFVKNSLLNKI